MANIVGICIGIVLIAAFAVFIYYLIYTRNINKKIKSENVSGRQLTDIPKIIMIAVIIVLTLFCGILTHSLRTTYNDAEKLTRNNYAAISISDSENYTYASYFGNAVLDDASFAKVYSIEENPGYTKEIIKDGEFTFTVFKRSSTADSFHPDFLCYCQYTGKINTDLELYHSGKFSCAEGSVGAGSGGNISDTLLFIGNIDEGTILSVSLYILDEKASNEFNDAIQKANEEDKGEFPCENDFAVSSGKVSIGF